MSYNLGFTDNYARMRIDELLREVENERIARLASRPGRPIRAQLAEWLFAAAEWVEGQPATAPANAEA